MNETTLRIFKDGAEIPFPVGSARNVSQDGPSPIRQAQHLRRSVNGELYDISRTSFRKYQVSISARDVTAPALAALWPGDRVTIHSVGRLYSVYTGDPTTLERDPVPGSVEAWDATGAPVAASVAGRDVSAPGAAYVRYRPVLDMRITSMEGGTDELNDADDWSLDLEEV